MTTTESARALRTGRLVLVLAAVLASGTFLQFAAGAMAPLYTSDLDLRPGDVGLLFACLLAVALLASPAAGRLVDRAGPRPALVAAPLLAGVGLVLAAGADGLGVLVAATLPAGLGMALVNPAVNSGAAALAGRDAGFVVGTAQFGVQAGAVVAGLLAVAGGAALPWRWALVGAAGACLVVATAARRLPSVSLRARATREPAPALERRAVLRLAGYALAMGTGSAVVFAFLPLSAVDAGVLAPSQAGWTAVLFGTVAVACRLALPRVLRTVGDAVLVVFALAAAASVLLVAAAQWLPGLLWPGTVLFGATGTTWPAVAMLAVVLASPGHRAGVQAGRVTAGFYAGLALGPLLAAAAFGVGGWTAVWTVSVTAYLAAGLLVATTGSAVSRTRLVGSA